MYVRTDIEAIKNSLFRLFPHIVQTKIYLRMTMNFFVFFTTYARLDFTIFPVGATFKTTNNVSSLFLSFIRMKT